MISWFRREHEKYCPSPLSLPDNRQAGPPIKGGVKPSPPLWQRGDGSMKAFSEYRSFQPLRGIDNRSKPPMERNFEVLNKYGNDYCKYFLAGLCYIYHKEKGRKR
jgi:hypothetical protein